MDASSEIISQLLFEEKLDYLLSKKVNLDDIIRLSVYYKIFPLFYKKACNLPLSFKDKTKLENTARYIKLKQAALKKEYSFILSSLNPLEIVVLKGYYLDSAVYEGQRQFLDIDIFIKKEDLSVVKKRLFSLGYKEQKDKFFPYRGQVSFSKNNFFFIDIHYKLMDWYRFNKAVNIKEQEIWKRKMKLYGNVFSLDYNDNFLYLCLHLCIQHYFRNPITFLDIKNYLKKFSSFINWKTIVKRAEDYKIKNIVMAVFFLLKQKVSGFNIDSEVPLSWRRGFNKKKFNRIYKLTYFPKGYYLSTLFLLDSLKSKGVFLFSCPQEYLLRLWEAVKNK